MRVDDLQSIQVRVASPEEILAWSKGEVVRPETINYRTQRPEKDGLFCEKIFGPEKDFQCYCGKYRGIRYKGVVCDKCGVEITRSSTRRENMGHIKLAAPCSHIWFLRAVPSTMGIILDIPASQLEQVIYFNSYIITQAQEEVKQKFLQAIDTEYRQEVKIAQQINSQTSAGSEGKKKKTAKAEGVKAGKLKAAKLAELKTAREKARNDVLELSPLKILSEIEYHELSLKYGEAFEAGTGAEILRALFEKMDLSEEIKNLKEKLNKTKKLKSPKPVKTKNQKPEPAKKDIDGPARRKALRRMQFLKRMLRGGVRPEWMFLTVIPILPPDLRPMVQLDGGRYASSDLNDLYRRVINRNNRLKYLLEISAPEVIVRNEKRMLQEAVDALIDNGMRKGQTTMATTGGKRLLKSLADMLKGKQGRFRQNLLGKRVDYSGRSVIVVGPELHFDQVGLPKKMALELFKPFVIRALLSKESAYNIRGASRLIEEEIDEVWACLEEVVKGKLVLLNRAPTLHRLGVQAFQPILIEGDAIRVHPLVCKAFNADFDGDQMAVHLPLSEKAQKEARELMRSSLNLLKPATGAPIVNATQDIILGCYFLTQIEQKAKGEGRIFSSSGEAVIAYEHEHIDLKAKIKIQMLKSKIQNKSKSQITKSELVETTVGRILFNEALPCGFRFINEQMNSKQLEEVVIEIIENYPSSKVKVVLDDIKRLGFESSTLSGVSWGMDDLLVPPKKKEIISLAEKEVEKINSHLRKGLLSREEKRARTIEVWQKAKSEVEKLVPQALKGGSVFSIIDSGARGSWVQPVQMAGMKGLVINPAGQIIELPVKASFKEGLNVLEYFISTHGARKGTADTALRTSAAGYLTRRLVDVSHEMIIFEKDCGDSKGFVVFQEDASDIGQNLSYKLLGRVAVQDIKHRDSKNNSDKGKVIVKKGEIIGRKQVAQIAKFGAAQIKIRSPLSCNLAEGICQKCYGWDLGLNKEVEPGATVGIVAAQAIGEPGTQLTMRTFHTGGVAGGGDITAGLPRVEEIFEARRPGGEAPMSLSWGRVIEITPDRIVKIMPRNLEMKELNKNKAKKKSKSNAKELKILEYKIPKARAIWVKKGDEISPGDQLCEGNLDLKQLFKAAGIEKTWRYIIQEIQKIYVSQGATIHDKHVEVITRQMFSRMRITEHGDSIFSSGDIIDRGSFTKEKERLSKKNLKPLEGKSVLLGVSKVALTTSSFLSAASFQETSRVLIKASVEAKEDKLRGLKENVIIGKLIPAGTGFRK